MEKIKKLFKRLVVDYIKDIVMPIPDTKKSSRILNIIWLAFAGICFVGGLIIAIFFPYMDSELFIIRFWYSWSLISALPFLPKFIKPIVKATKVSVKVGKAINWEHTEAYQVASSGNVNFYELRKEKRSLAGILGLVTATVATLFEMLLGALFGVILLVIRALLTVKELTKHTPAAVLTDADIQKV